jgi:hypothetical protein
MDAPIWIFRTILVRTLCSISFSHSMSIGQFWTYAEKLSKNKGQKK